LDWTMLIVCKKKKSSGNMVADLDFTVKKPLKADQ
jgi:hypothetical protein